MQKREAEEPQSKGYNVRKIRIAVSDFEARVMDSWVNGYGQPLKSEEDMKVGSLLGPPERNTVLPIS